MKMFFASALVGSLILGRAIGQTNDPNGLISWLYTENNRVAVCNNGQIQGHPAFNTNQYPMCWMVPSLCPLPEVGGVGSVTINWSGFTPNSSEFLFMDPSPVSPFPWIGCCYVLPTVLMLSAADSLGNVIFSWSVPTALPLSVLPTGRTNVGNGQVVEICPNQTFPCNGSFIFSIDAQR